MLAEELIDELLHGLFLHEHRRTVGSVSLLALRSDRTGAVRVRVRVERIEEHGEVVIAQLELVGHNVVLIGASRLVDRIERLYKTQTLIKNRKKYGGETNA